MAAALKRQFELLALKVRLRSQDGEQDLEPVLEYFGRPDGSPLDLGTIRLTPALDGVVAEVAARLENRMPSVGAPAHLPLWLHLAKPYGQLGSLHWEAALEKAAGRPVLRLPDFLERSREQLDTLDVAICCDTADTDAFIRIRTIIEQTLSGSPRPHVAISVFVQKRIARRVRQAFRGDRRVKVFTPATDPTARQSPWFTGISASLGGKPCDMVHFICRGSVAFGVPHLKIADPATDAARVRYASIREVSGWLTTLGAWAAAFTPVEEGPQLILRRFADALAQARPGAVFYCPHAVFKEQIAFLFAPTPVPAARLHEGFLYCQPGIAMDLERTVSVSPAIEKNADLFRETLPSVLSAANRIPVLDFARDILTSASAQAAASRLSTGVSAALSWAGDFLGLKTDAPDTKPTWIVAAQRFVESSSLVVLRGRSPDALLSDLLDSFVRQQLEPDPPARSPQPDNVVEKTLMELQSIVARHAHREGGGSQP